MWRLWPGRCCKEVSLQLGSPDPYLSALDLTGPLEERFRFGRRGLQLGLVKVTRKYKPEYRVIKIQWETDPSPGPNFSKVFFPFYHFCWCSYHTPQCRPCCARACCVIKARIAHPASNCPGLIFISLIHVLLRVSLSLRSPANRLFPPLNYTHTVVETGQETQRHEGRPLHPLFFLSASAPTPDPATSRLCALLQDLPADLISCLLI